MSPIIAMSAHTGVILAEVAFLLLLISGVWSFASELSENFRGLRRIVAHITLAVAGILLIIATHYGHFG